MDQEFCSNEQFISAMRQFGAAVSVVTTGVVGERQGLTATAVISLTAEPPRIACAVNRTASAYPSIIKSGHFCINVLSSSQLGIGNRFAMDPSGEGRFECGVWELLSTGAPALSGALANIDCELYQEIDFGTHSLIVGNIKETRVEQGQMPLFYLDQEWVTSGELM